MITCRDNRLKLRIIVSIFVLVLTLDNNVYGFNAKKFSYLKQEKIIKFSGRILIMMICITNQIDGGQLLSYEFGVQFNDR